MKHWYYGRGLAEAITNETEADVKRHVGVPGSFVKPGFRYEDGCGQLIQITGFSSSDGGYLGVDGSGVFRTYNEYGQCITLSTGRSNEGEGRKEFYDLKVL